MKKLSVLILLALCACTPKIHLYDEANATADMEVYAEQYSLNKAEWDAVFRFLADPATAKLPAGQYPITDSTFAKVQIDSTRTSMNYEDHHKKIDLFYIVEGSELINVCKPSSLAGLVDPYNPAKDVEHYSSSSDYKPVVLTPGKYVILFPSDAHQPMLAPDGLPAPIHKIVVKIPYVQAQAK